MTTIDSDRHILLEGNYNARDIGGYPIEGGGSTRWKVFLRSDRMDLLTAADQAKLVDYGVRSIIDLRTVHETRETPNVFVDSDQVPYVHCDLMGDTPTPLTAEELAHGLPAVRIERAYTGWLDYRKAQFAEVLGRLADPGTGPVLYHCAGGKDRTGVISALLLGIAGVPRDVILDDYTLTSEFLYRRALLGGARPEEKPVSSPREYADEYCPRDGMARTLAHLDRGYGGIEAYVRAIGLTEGQIETLREMLIE